MRIRHGLSEGEPRPERGAGGARGARPAAGGAARSPGSCRARGSGSGSPAGLGSIALRGAVSGRDVPAAAAGTGEAPPLPRSEPAVLALRSSVCSVLLWRLQKGRWSLSVPFACSCSQALPLARGADGREVALPPQCPSCCQ